MNATGPFARLRIRLFGDPDATVLVRRAQPKRRLWLALSAGLAVLLVAGGGWVALGIRHAAPVQSQFLLPLADEPTILANSGAHTTFFRFAPAPSIIVVLFASLHEQAVMLNRIAVFVEAASGPRDRVLDDAELRANIAAAGQSFDSYYYGHDYRAADLARFFATADSDHVALNGSEKQLRAMIATLAVSSGGFGALISLPPPGHDLQDLAGRSAILRHELSHGLYFTDPRYAAMVTDFWDHTLTAQQRGGFRHFLGGSGYDSGNEDLMRNEAQAYLIHTRDTRFFTPAAAGLTDAEAASLRSAFVRAMPGDWLRDRTSP